MAKTKTPDPFGDETPLSADVKPDGDAANGDEKESRSLFAHPTIRAANDIVRILSKMKPQEAVTALYWATKIVEGEVNLAMMNKRPEAPNLPDGS